MNVIQKFLAFMILVLILTKFWWMFLKENDDVLFAPSIMPWQQQSLDNIECLITNTDGICMYGTAVNRLNNESILCSGPIDQLNCNDSIRSVMMTGCNGRLGNVMMAYATLYYFHYKMGFNGILEEYQANVMSIVFEENYVIKQGKIRESPPVPYVVEGVAENDEIGAYFYTKLFNNPDQYKQNKLLDVGIYPSPFYLFEEIWPELRKQFQFKEEILKSAKSSLALSTEVARGRYKGVQFIYIAVHNRRGDYLGTPKLEEFFASDDLQAEFFMNCMDIYRNKFDTKYTKTIFVMLSNDVEWFRTYFGHLPDVGFPDTFAPLKDEMLPGRDMAIFKLCNGVIRTFGTYSIWGGFLSGGMVLSPHTGKQLITEHIVGQLNRTDHWVMVDIQPLLDKYRTNTTT